MTVLASVAHRVVASGRGKGLSCFSIASPVRLGRSKLLPQVAFSSTERLPTRKDGKKPLKDTVPTGESSPSASIDGKFTKSVADTKETLGSNAVLELSSSSSAKPSPKATDTQPATEEVKPFFKPTKIHRLDKSTPQGNFLEFAPRITVIGVGGAGGNAVNNMILRDLKGVEFMVCNTDSQHLSTTLTDNRLQLGRTTTEGLGCGANPDSGRQAATESKEEILEMIEGSHMVFITAGMGGGTGTGASPVIAEACLEAGILTVAVVTKPFRFEGAHRMRLADEGLGYLKDTVDTLIVIPNQNLFQLVEKQTSLMDAFRLADDVLLAGVRSVTDLMVNPGLINLDFADVVAVMAGMGNAMMGTGEGEGEDRAVRAAEDALSNPLLGDLSVQSAKGLLVNITGGSDLTLFEVDQAASRVTEEVGDPAANIIIGSAYDKELEGIIRVAVVATGIDVSQDELKM
ncbi:unnamed protein product [Discosporangium mesarthrocarpum]